MIKSVDHYIALAAAMLIVAMQHKEKPWAARVTIAGASGGIGNSIAPEVAQMTAWLGEVSAMVVVTALIYGALDTIAALIADREVIKSIAWGRFGRRK